MRRRAVARALLVLLAAVTAGCSTIIEGTRQEIAVKTVPDGATCNLSREGFVIAVIPATPGKASVDKNKHDITIVCEKDGYEAATYENKSDVAAAQATNLLLLWTAPIGWAIDASTGANNKYAGEVELTLRKK
jgi:hypothetical protein